MLYQQQRNKLLHTYTQELQLEADEYLQGQFALVSAGLVNYLPEIPIATHSSVYKEVLLHQQLSVLEQNETGVLEYVQPEGPCAATLERLRTAPAVICTMHTGSYRVLNLFLIQLRIPFTLVAGTAVLTKEGDTFQRIYSKLNPNEADGLRLIDAESSTAGLQMLRELKKGRSLVLYIDGHTGAGKATSDNANSCLVDFLGQQLYVRKGIAYLAHAAGVPILPVACYRKNMDDIRLRFYTAIEPDRSIDRDVFAATATQQMYYLFGEVIRAYPEQWEGWLTIHKTAKIVHAPVDVLLNEQKTGENILFNSYRFGIFKTGGIPYVLQKHQYLFYEIDDPLYRLLIACIEEPIAATKLADDLLTELIGKGIVYFV